MLIKLGIVIFSIYLWKDCVILDSVDGRFWNVAFFTIVHIYFWVLVERVGMACKGAWVTHPALPSPATIIPHNRVL